MEVSNQEIRGIIRKLGSCSITNCVAWRGLRLLSESSHREDELPGATTEKNTTCRPGSTNLVGLQKSNEKCVSDILFLLQCIFFMSPVQKTEIMRSPLAAKSQLLWSITKTRRKKTAGCFTMDATPNVCTQLSSVRVPNGILILSEKVAHRGPINPTNQYCWLKKSN